MSAPSAFEASAWCPTGTCGGAVSQLGAGLSRLSRCTRCHRAWPTGRSPRRAAPPFAGIVALGATAWRLDSATGAIAGTITAVRGGFLTRDPHGMPLGSSASLAAAARILWYRQLEQADGHGPGARP